MPLKTTNLKFTTINKIAAFIFLALPFFSNAQEVVTIDSTGVIKNNETVIQPRVALNDSLKKFNRYKAEAVTGVVGDYVILDSDIDKSYIEIQAQGGSIEGITRCQLMGKLMEDKLYAHQAKIDSILVPDTEINQKIDQQIEYMVSELGSEEKVAKYYRKDNMADLRKELFEVNKTNELAGAMQRRVVEKVEVTPEEIRQFFYAIPEEDRPVFGSEIEVAQIVAEPAITEKARQDAINKLADIRADIVDNGASFATKAVLYSKDGSASKGGYLGTLRRDSPYAKDFKDVAFSLLEGEVSEPFETEFGFHIVYVETIRGQEIDVRHIIVFPDVSQEEIDKAKKRLEETREKIIAGTLTFSDGAKAYSDEKETRNNGGQLVNPVSLDTKFDLTKMDPTLSAQVYNLEEGEVSKIYTDRDYTGKSEFKILTVTKKYPEHPADYVKDYERIKELALRKKQIEAIGEWQEKKIKETYVNVSNDYNDCDFTSNWLKK